MSTPSARQRVLALVATVAFLAACGSNPTPTPSPSETSTPSPAPTPSPTPEPQPFPLAVVTGLTNLKSVTNLDELITLAKTGKLVVPCGVTISQPTLSLPPSCVSADKIVAAIVADQKLVALLPPGLVEPATKVLPIAGDGPFGLFGPDLFGDPQARAKPYPVMGVATGGVATVDGGGALDPTWTTYDASQVWTMTSIGSLCADRQAAYQAVTLGKGWDWVFDGGTAKYTGPPFYNPYPPPGISSFPIVQPVETGNNGVTASINKRSDVALADHKCPILPTNEWAPSLNGPPSLAVPEAVLARWKNFLGIDAVYLAADHQSDRGVAGISSTLQLLDKNKFPHTGLGMNLDQALAPAYVQVAGLKVAFVSWNEVAGPTHAGPTTPGVAWLTEANVNAAVGRA
ncbi:MAG: CapA family protein, partial [Actinomycetota bacterium]|nr:CapA family protein [Actinomycetota bacterium]